ncbi:hypothetical protein [Comamonas testosteroni]|uniref:hypothetical protein n=1 Tax=Comamonas testosteroni TaxID=285 RepID=UPI0026ED2A40|nr:hypothetical protein [Comamonas testosteroni]
MSGSVQTVLVCQTSQNTDSFNVCPTGQALTTAQAYLIDSSSEPLFENTLMTDYSMPAEFFGLAISCVLTAWLTAKGFGYLIRLLK